MNGIKKNFAAMALGTLAAVGTAYAENQDMAVKTDQAVDESLCITNTDHIEKGSEGVMALFNIMAFLADIEDFSFETYSANNGEYTFMKVTTEGEVDGHLLVNEKAETVCEVTAGSYNRFKPPAP